MNNSGALLKSAWIHGSKIFAQTAAGQIQKALQKNKNYNPLIKKFRENFLYRRI